MGMQTIEFAQYPLYAIARDRISHLAGNSHTKTPTARPGGKGKNQKMPAMIFTPMFIAAQKLLPLADAPGRRITV